MPARSSLEKSPVDASVYEGLQVDTRAKDNKAPFLDESKPQGYLDDDFDNERNYMNEKQAHPAWGQVEDPRSPNFLQSPGSHGTTFADSPLPPTPQFKPIDSVFPIAEVPPEPREKRICGLKKKHFWEIFGLILALVIAAAIVGGVVGGLQYKNENSPGPAYGGNVTIGNGTAPNTTANAPVISADVLADSPLSVVSYDIGGDGDPNSRQSLRVYYQSVLGNVKEAVSNGQTAWQSAVPIFTDALNNTGLAAVTYLNGTQQQGTIFYVGMNGLMQEKRKILSSTVYWEPGTLNALNLPAVGNISLPLRSTPDPKDGVGSYAMAAVYSQNFSTGAGIRFFYHAESLNGTSFVQEMIWTQSNDSWTKGAEIPNVWPNSKLTVTIDDSTRLLRLFFTTGSQTLQEMYCDISGHGGYQNGMRIENYLDRNTADLAAVSENGTTYIYHYATINQTANVGIHELAIRGTPGSYTNQESYNLSEPLVFTPQLTWAADKEQSAFQPLAAAKTVVPGISPKIFVFWADNVVGDSKALSGYHALSETSRLESNPMWPSTQPLPVLLGSSNSYPSRKRSLFPWFYRFL